MLKKAPHFWYCKHASKEPAAKKSIRMTMTKLFKGILFLLFASISTVAIAQNPTDDVEYQEYLRLSREKMIQKQKLINAQKGKHYGLELITETLDDWIDEHEDNITNSSKFGIRGLFLNRKTEHWMIGASAGLELMTPFRGVAEKWNREWEYIEYKRPILNLSLLGETRFYFGTARLMPFWYLNGGAVVSKYIGLTAMTGIGVDYNFDASKTFFFSLGAGVDASPYKDVDHKTDKLIDKIKVELPFTVRLSIGFYL